MRRISGPVADVMSGLLGVWFVPINRCVPLASRLAPRGGRSILRRHLRSTPMAQSSPQASVIQAYWQPGCTSCLRMKEFLTKHGVPFISVNVLEDKDAFAELAMLGIRSVPIVRRGKDWANGQVLRDVARVAGIAWGGAQVLPAPELAARLRPARLSHLQHRRCLPRARGAGLAAQGRRVRPRAAAGDEHQGQDSSLRTRRAGTIQG